IGFYRKVDDLITIDFDVPAWPEGFYVNSPEAVKVWGGEAVVSARLTDWLDATFDWTHTDAKMVGTEVQLTRIPKDQVKAILNATAPGGRYGGTASLNWVGDVFENLPVIGRVNHGNYAVV